MTNGEKFTSMEWTLLSKYLLMSQKPMLMIKKCLLSKKTSINSKKEDSMLSDSESCGLELSPNKDPITRHISKKLEKSSKLLEMPVFIQFWNSIKKFYLKLFVELVFQHGLFKETTDTELFLSQFKDKSILWVITWLLIKHIAKDIVQANIFILMIVVQDLMSFTRLIPFWIKSLQSSGKKWLNISRVANTLLHMTW